MPIPEKDIKKLWGLSAGRCNYPGCPNDCIVVLDTTDTALIGEMAHVIAESPDGPRGDGEGGQNTYSNLILLCPYHHRLIDKEPAHFPEEMIREWKRVHEEKITKLISMKSFETKKDLFRFIKELLIENKNIWKTYGPESDEAKNNPYSSLVHIWNKKRFEVIIPNNSKITDAIKSNSNLLSSEELLTAYSFITHAQGFEISCLTRTEGIPRFPKDFEVMINE